MTELNIIPIHGLLPEQAAMLLARYSRSKDSMLDILKEISQQKASSFYEKVAISYGHSSVKDLANLLFGIENISMIGALTLLNSVELINAQERSTRYQSDFVNNPAFYTPDEFYDKGVTEKYWTAIKALFEAYKFCYPKLVSLIIQGMDTAITHSGSEDARIQKAAEALALDNLRVLLPYSTLTSVGQSISARSFERQLTALYSANSPELEEVAEGLREACEGYYYNGEGTIITEPYAPTLVKRVAHRTLENRMLEKAKSLLPDINRLNEYYGQDKMPIIEEGHHIEVLAGIIYMLADLTWAEANYLSANMINYDKRLSILTTLNELRESHQELPNFFRHATFNYEVEADTKSVIDLARHRRVVKLLQPVSEEPEYIVAHDWFYIGLPFKVWEKVCDTDICEVFNNAIKLALRTYTELRQMGLSQAYYVLPMATRRRMLMKMDLAEADYIIALRSKPGGHFAYRKIALDMHNKLEEDYFYFSKFVKVSALNEDDWLKRS